MGGPSSNSLARLSQSTAAAGGISTLNSPHTGNAAKYSPAFSGISLVATGASALFLLSRSGYA